MGKSCVKSPITVSAVIAVLMAVAVLGGCTGAGKNSAGLNQDHIAATVNGENVYFQDVNEFYAYQTLEQQAVLTKSDALSQVIEREILYQEAVRNGFGATTEEIALDYNNFLNARNMTAAAEETELAAKNSSVERFRSALGKRIAISKLYDSKIPSQFIIKHEEVEALYNASDFRSLNISFDDAESSIVNYLTAQKRTAQWNSYVASLKDSAKVMIIAVPN